MRSRFLLIAQLTLPMCYTCVGGSPRRFFVRRLIVAICVTSGKLSGLAQAIYARQTKALQTRQSLAHGTPTPLSGGPPRPVLGAEIPPSRLRQSQAAHPLGLPVGALIAPPVPGGPAALAADGFMQRTLANATTLVWHSVQAQTRDQYSVPWNHWQSWAAEFGTDRFLRIKPPCWTPAVAAEFSFGFAVAAMVSFVAYLFGDLGLKPCTVSSYVSGVKFMLQMSGVDTRVVDTDPTFRRLKTGCCIAYRSTHPEYDDKTMPFTIEMIVAAQRYTDQTSVEGYMAVSAMKIAYCCLLRKSEYLLQSKTKHHLKGRCVMFVHRLPDGSEITVSSEKAWTCGLSSDTLYEIVVDVLSAKNDANGAGHRLAFLRVRLTDRPAGQPFDLAEDMWRYAVWARPTQEGPFFVYRQSIRLSYHNLTKHIKATAARMGFNQAFFSTHSLRIGGASALAAAGVPDYIIQTMGRWKSLAFLMYIRLASSAYNAALAKMCNTATLTVSDLRRITTAVPGAVNA